MAAMVVAGAACGGANDQAATTASPATVAEAAEAAEDPSAAGSGEDPATAPGEAPPLPAPQTAALSEGCRALVVELLQIIEPHVAGLGLDEIAAAGIDLSEMAAAAAPTEQRIEQECPAMDNPQAFEMLIDLARQEAPGSVRYLESIAAGAAWQPG